MLWYSSEAPNQGASNEYIAYVFVEKSEKYQYFLVEKSTLSGIMFMYAQICLYREI